MRKETDLPAMCGIHVPATSSPPGCSTLITSAPRCQMPGTQRCRRVLADLDDADAAQGADRRPVLLACRARDCETRPFGTVGIDGRDALR